MTLQRDGDDPDGGAGPGNHLVIAVTGSDRPRTTDDGNSDRRCTLLLEPGSARSTPAGTCLGGAKMAAGGAVQ